MQLKHHSIILIFFAPFFISCSAQKNGYVVKNANDTIRGKFKLTISPESSAYAAPTVLSVYNLKNTKTNIYTDSIKKIDIIKRRKVANSYIISGNNFWREIAAKDNFGIYKRKYIIIEGAGTTFYDVVSNQMEDGSSEIKYLEIALFSGNTKIEEFYNTGPNFSLLKKKTLQFIDDRYNVKLTKWKDISSQKKLFDFILNKEIELEKKL